jgi:hypothetical protein
MSFNKITMVGNVVASPNYVGYLMARQFVTSIWRQ